MGFATGKHALGICDRCGFSFKLNSLRFQQVDGRMTALKVCRSCLDIDNEQWQVRLLDLTDNEALRDPRPEEAFAVLAPALEWGEGVPLEWGAYRRITWGPDVEVSLSLLWGSELSLEWGRYEVMNWG